MRKSILFLFALFLISACNSLNTREEENSSEKGTTISIEEFYSHPEEYTGREVTITGLVTHVCKHGGQKLFISNPEGDATLRIDVGEDIPEFDIAMEGSEAQFTGVIRLMDDDFVAMAQEEHLQHHGEEAENENSLHEMKDKNYHLIARNFQTP